MGCISSKQGGKPAGIIGNNSGSSTGTTTTTTTTASISSKSMVTQYKAELSSYYEEACKIDPKLQSFSTTLRQRTTRVISSLAADAATLHSLSCRSLNEATDGILGISHDALNNILDLKEEIATNPDLLRFVNEYFKNTVETLKFFKAMKECLGRARETGSMVRDAVRCYNEADYEATLQKLREFKEAGDPFTENFIGEFKSVWEQQRATLSDLDRQKQELDQKLGTVRAWRKVWAIVYAVVFVATAICSVLLAALAAPPVATAAAAAAMTAIGSIGEWIDSLWDRCEEPMENGRTVISSMEVGTYYAIHELASVKALADELEDRISGMVGTAQLAVSKEGEEAVKVAMEDIKKKIKAFTKSVKKLEKKLKRCSRGIGQATEGILMTITNSA